jgi:hypothetical protein
MTYSLPLTKELWQAPGIHIHKGLAMSEVSDGEYTQENLAVLDLASIKYKTFDISVYT